MAKKDAQLSPGAALAKIRWDRATPQEKAAQIVILHEARRKSGRLGGRPKGSVKLQVAEIKAIGKRGKPKKK